MRIKFYLVLLFILGSALVYQSTSFTSAEIRNEATLSVVPEEVALIAITYGEGRSFTITNNTEKSVAIVNNGNIALDGNFPSFLEPGQIELYSIKSEPEEVDGGSIQLIANWEGGKAEINSDIPQSNIEFILLELTALDMEIVPLDSIDLLESEDVELDLVEKDEDEAVETVKTVDETNVTEPIDEKSPTEMEDEVESTDIEETAPDNE